MAKNPYLHGSCDTEKQSVAYWRSSKQESSIAKRVGGKRVLGSGSKLKKGDVYVKDIARIECKTTCKKSFSVTQEMIEKITIAGSACNELPAIVVEFLSAKGKPLNEVAVIPMWALELLISQARDADRG